LNTLRVRVVANSAIGAFKKLQTCGILLVEGLNGNLRAEPTAKHALTHIQIPGRLAFPI
jgi:hypothetical protein